MYPELITDSKLFEAVFNDCGAVFDIARRLPDFVFKKNLIYYSFPEIVTHNAGFPATLYKLGSEFHDEFVNYISLEPDPQAYYRDKVGFFGGARFTLDMIQDEEHFAEVMSRGGEADSFFNRGGDVGAYFGSSKAWGIFVDRRSWDLAILGTPRAIPEEYIASIETFSGHQIKRFVEENYRSAPRIALDFLAKLSSNYPALGVT